MRLRLLVLAILSGRTWGQNTPERAEWSLRWDSAQGMMRWVISISPDSPARLGKGRVGLTQHPKVSLNFLLQLLLPYHQASTFLILTCCSSFSPGYFLSYFFLASWISYWQGWPLIAMTSLSVTFFSAFWTDILASSGNVVSQFFKAIFFISCFRRLLNNF